jgi:hypothetical protein
MKILTDLSSYNGQAIVWDDNGCEEQILVSGRILIDTDSFNRLSPYMGRHLKPLNSKDVHRLSFQNNAYRESGRQTGKDFDDDEPPEKLTTYHHIICRPTVRGYFPELEMWLDFFVDNVSDQNIMEGERQKRWKETVDAGLARWKAGMNSVSNE